MPCFSVKDIKISYAITLDIFTLAILTLHILTKREKLLENEVEKCIFIIYKNGVKSYKLWNLVIRNIVYNRDVNFTEFERTLKHEDE